MDKLRKKFKIKVRSIIELEDPAGNNIIKSNFILGEIKYKLVDTI